MKLFPDFVRQKRGGLSIWFDRKYAAPSEIELFANADRLFEQPECELVKDQRKIKVARIPLSLDGQARAIYLKRYNSFSWRVKLASVFAPSGAVRSLRGAAILSNAQVSTATPVAAAESRRWGVLTKSFFFSEEIKGGKTADSYWCGDLQALKGNQGYHRRRGFLEELALLFKSLHERGIYHNDLKDANILVRADGSTAAESFFLLDLEGIRRYGKLSERRRIKNLVQLNRTLGRHVRRAAKLYFLKRYLGEAFVKEKDKRRWAAKVVRISQRVDRLKSLDETEPSG